MEATMFSPRASTDATPAATAPTVSAMLARRWTHHAREAMAISRSRSVVVVTMPPGDGGVLEVVAGAGERVTSGARASVGEVVRRAITDWRPAAASGPAGAAVAAAPFFAGGVRGAVCLADVPGRQWTDATLGALHGVAVQVGESIVRSRAGGAVGGDRILRAAPPAPAREPRLAMRPVVSLVRGEITEFEAVISPGRTGVNGMLVAVADAFRQARSWAFSDDRLLSIAIPVTGVHLDDPRFARGIAAAHRSAGLTPEQVRILIPADALLRPTTQAVYTVMALRASEVRLDAIDLGAAATDATALAALHRVPVDRVTLDAATVARMHDDLRARATVRDLFQLADRAGLSVIARGVSSAPQARALTRLGCQHATGPYFSPPVAPARAGELAAGWGRNGGSNG